MNLHPAIKFELENLAIRFPGQSQINLDEYAALYRIRRESASQHLRRRNIPATKEGRGVYISLLDLATYKAKCKSGNEPLIVKPENISEFMKRQRGFNQMAERKQLGR